MRITRNFSEYYSEELRCSINAYMITKVFAVLWKMWTLKINVLKLTYFAYKVEIYAA